MVVVAVVVVVVAVVSLSFRTLSGIGNEAKYRLFRLIFGRLSHWMLRMLGMLGRFSEDSWEVGGSGDGYLGRFVGILSRGVGFLKGGGCRVASARRRQHQTGRSCRDNDQR